MGDGAMKASDVKVGMVVRFAGYAQVKKISGKEAFLSWGEFSQGWISISKLRPLTKRERGEGGAK
jgi:hypothetical protein